MKIVTQHAGRGCWVTTMVDLYALPTDVPGFTTAQQTPDPYQRVAQIETALGEDISYRRFIPYIQLHEFEALLLAEPSRILDDHPEAGQGVTALTREISGFQGPEWVDDGTETAPSKRIKKYVPQYDKVRSGPDIAGRIGLPVLRHCCPHFGDWLAKLEALSSEA